MTIARPAPAEYVPYFAAYVSKAEDDPLAQLDGQAIAISHFSSIADGIASMNPGPDQWSPKQILVHLCDCERMFNYRALRFSRGDATPVEAFEQDPYVAASEANNRSLNGIIEELLALRSATLLLFGAMSLEMLERSGTAGGNAVSVRALLFIIAGHCEGHLRDIQRMFPERR